ncbi:thioredoxin [Devosia riboflavina]|uniref:Thioredoxin n=1 Tax=Devosia riboflavina TaxID=46914 RepID=A0A087M0G8_9HYPH|nr:thioredoxin [Devosia riboflavina]KFL30371.1 thioredoxin [Devosia riboflavina]
MALHVSDSNFAAEVLEADRPVLVDFWAEWCPPCKAMAPTIDALAEELAADFKIVKLDVDSNPGITVAYNVRAMPTLIIFKDGVPVDVKVGAGQSRVQLIKWLESHAA